MKYGCIDVSVKNGLRQPLSFIFVLNKPSGFKIICEPQTLHVKNKQICFDY